MKSICDYCQAGEVRSVRLTRVVVPGGSEYRMCDVCRGICLSQYLNQNLAPATRVDLARAVRYIIAKINGGER